MAREVVWEFVGRPGLEHLALETTAAAIRASGLVVVQLGADVLRISYSVELDGGWAFREARLDVECQGATKSLEILRSIDGNWAIDGAVRPDLAACVDIDIMATPFTNSLPIRRLRLAPDVPQAITVAYIRMPDLMVAAAPQEYTRLDEGDPPREFRYRNLTSGFTAGLSVDEHGLVLDYHGVWRRRA